VIKACTYIEACNGYFITLTDEEILEAITELGKETGLFAEPAGAVPYGGLKKLIYEGKITESDTVCLVITGNGLKDVSAVEGLINARSLSIKELEKRFE
jgi:threonine synthase